MNISDKNSRGSVAILALWVIVVLAFLAVGLGFSTRQKLLVFDRIQKSERARVLGESTVKKVITEIRSLAFTSGDLATGEEWYFGKFGKIQPLSVGSEQVNFTLEDETAKINLNKTTPAALIGLFKKIAHLQEEDAIQLAQAIVDFRDSDDYVTSEASAGKGSERGIYRQAGLAHGPKNAEFEWIGEVMLVCGMTKEVYSFIENYITIYGDGRVNINTCSVEVLYALEILPSVAEKIIQVRSGRDRQAGTDDDFLFKDISKIASDLGRFFELTDVEVESLQHAMVQRYFRVTSDQFRIFGRSGDGSSGFSRAFSCVYSVKEGIRYWMES